MYKKFLSWKNISCNLCQWIKKNDRGIFTKSRSLQRRGPSSKLVPIPSLSDSPSLYYPWRGPRTNTPPAAFMRRRFPEYIYYIPVETKGTGKHRIDKHGVRHKESLLWYSHAVPTVFPEHSHSTSIVFPSRSPNIPMTFLCYSHSGPIVFHGIPIAFPQHPQRIPMAFQ